MSGVLPIRPGLGVFVFPRMAAIASRRPIRAIVVISAILFNPPFFVVDPQLDADCGRNGE